MAKLHLGCGNQFDERGQEITDFNREMNLDARAYYGREFNARR